MQKSYQLSVEDNEDMNQLTMKEMQNARYSAETFVYGKASHQRWLRAGSSTISVAAGPGGTKTDGMRTGIASIPFAPMRWMADAVTNAIMLSPEQGILPVLRAATDPDAAGGGYFTPSGCMSMRGAPEATPPKGDATDAQLARDLWESSVELTGVDVRRTRAMNRR